VPYFNYESRGVRGKGRRRRGGSMKRGNCPMP